MLDPYFFVWHPHTRQTFPRTFPAPASVIEQGRTYVWVVDSSSAPVSQVTRKSANYMVVGHADTPCVTDTTSQQEWFTLVNGTPGSAQHLRFTSSDVSVPTDPAGTRPVYYVTNTEGTWVSNSATALAELVGKEPDREWLAAHLLLGYRRSDITTSRSAYLRVNRVPPGHALVVSDRHAVVVPSFDFSQQTSFSDASRNLRRGLSEGISQRLKGSARITTDLSGGLDSSAVTVLAADSPERTGPVSAIVFASEQTRADTSYAVRVASTRSESVQLHVAALADIRRYEHLTSLSAHDNPSAEAVAVSRTQVTGTRLNIRQGMHLTGHGGDSVLTVQAPVLLEWLARHRRWRELWSYATLWGRLRQRSPYHLLRDAIHAAHSTPERVATAQHSCLLLDFPRWRAAGLAADPQMFSHEARELASALLRIPAGDEERRRLWCDVWDVASDARAETQLGWAFGVDLQCPFLDSSVVSASMTAPVEGKNSRSAAKPLLTAACGSHLPEFLVNRVDKGDYTSAQHEQLYGHLQELKHLVETSRLSDLGLIVPSAAVSALDAVVYGKGSSVPMLERVLSAEGWLRSFDKQSGISWACSTELVDRSVVREGSVSAFRGGAPGPAGRELLSLGASAESGVEPGVCNIDAADGRQYTAGLSSEGGVTVSETGPTDSRLDRHVASACERGQRSSVLMVAALYVASAGVSRLKFSRLVRVAEVCGQFANFEPSVSEATQVVSRVRVASERIGVRAACLETALTSFLVLAAHGKRARVVLGVKDLPFASHAWVEVGGVPVGEPADLLGTFTEIFSFPSYNRTEAHP